MRKTGSPPGGGRAARTARKAGVLLNAAACAALVGALTGLAAAGAVKTSAPAAAQAGAPAQAGAVRVGPAEVEPGEFLRVLAQGSPRELSGEFGGTTFRFYEGPGGQAVALLSASYDLEPGRYWVVVRTPSGEVGRQAVVVRPRAFPVQRLRVSASKEALVRSEDPQLVARRRREAEEVREARSDPSQRPLWDGPFIWPLQGPIHITSEYGLIREVNGRVTGRHSGLDLAAPEGTPVRAANGGRVVLARDHLVTGNTVILDHGWGLFTSYLHLSAILVREGQVVRKGEVIGRVGATGLSTGPHLHWAAWLPDGFIDPRVLTKGPLWPPDFASAGI